MKEKQVTMIIKDVPESVRQALRMESAKSGKTMKLLIVEALKAKYLKK